MKGQLFIITFVFLSGLVTAVAGLLLQYSQLDASEPYLRSDAFIMRSILRALNGSIDPIDCSKTEQNIQQLIAFLDRNPPTTFDLDIAWQLDCPSPQDQTLAINLTNIGPGIESRASWVCTAIGCV